MAPFAVGGGLNRQSRQVDWHMSTIYSMFGKFYDLIYGELVDYEGDCDMLNGIFRKFADKKPATLLDIGCGTGSHALILTKRRFEVTGIDTSRPMLEEAERKADEEKAKIRFELQDMRSMDLGTTFDAAISLSGTFGYLKDIKDMESFLHALRTHLNQKGLFVFEFWNTGAVKTDHKDWLTRKKGDSTLIRLSHSVFDPQTNVLNIAMKYFVIENSKVTSNFEELHRVRTFTIPEIRYMVEENEFELLTTLRVEGPKKRPERPTKDTLRILAVAKAR